MVSNADENKYRNKKTGTINTKNKEEFELEVEKF